MFCIYCGARVADDARICPVCGNTVLVAGEPELAPENNAEPQVVTAERATEDTIIADIPMKPAAQQGDQPDDGRDIYSTAPHRFREELEMEDISSGEQIDIPPVEYKAPQSEPVQQNVPYMNGYQDGYVYEEFDESLQKPKKKRVWIWFAVIVPILLAIGGTAIGIYIWYNAPSQQFSRALEADDYAKITQLLPQLEDSERDALAADMKEYAAKAVQRYNNGEVEYSAAYDLVDRLQRLFPDALELQTAAEQMKTLKASKESFASAQSAEQTGDVHNALRLFGEVSELDTNYEAAQTRITQIKADYKASVLEEAQALADAGDFTGAQTVLTESSAILGDDPDIRAKMTELQDMETENYVTSMLEMAQDLVDEGDLIGAVKLLEETTKEDPRFTQQIEKYKETYKTEKLQEAQAYADASDYEEAVAVLESAKSFLGEDEKLTAKIKEYKDMYPVLLVDLAPSGGSNCSSVWGATGSDGSQYSNGLSFALYPEVAETVETEYSPGGKYKRFSGTWVVENNTTDRFIGKIRVYVDGSLQYELSSLTVSSSAAEMNLLISGAQTIRIEAEGAFADPRQVGYIYLAGATFRN